MEKKLLFSLDIGTRSVIGIVAEQVDNTLKIIATERKEHNTRAMMDGQIHDVPEVAIVLEDVKKMLEKKVGPLNDAAVAAAGRALYTINAESEIDVSEVLTIDDEHTLDYAAIQAAQKKLATSGKIDDPTLYYCVGYSTIHYKLDGIQLKTLVGQRGKKAQASVIATFLPRQVIDSMQSALHEAKLNMKALTLEPIAAINVLIPPTMRHLNLVLVDIGAGTSDIAITKNGSVIAYGMVPIAGDEITEAISQHYLLDFNVAEEIKRKLSEPSNEENNHVVFNDILGMEHKIAVEEAIKEIAENVAELAQAIANQILALNGEPPQAVLLVGGGSLTPLLPESIAAALDIPQPRVAVRTPDTVQGIEQIPDILHHPDCVTPLGILKIAASQSLNFITIYVNNNEYHLFNISKLTVSDALLAAGINIKQLGGKPGLGLTVNINGEMKFYPGSMGRPAKLMLNEENTTFSTPIEHGDKISVVMGVDGKAPVIHLKDIIDAPPAFVITINDEEFTIDSHVLVNKKEADKNYQLMDRDEITYQQLTNLGEILTSVGYNPKERHFSYTVNGTTQRFTTTANITINNQAAKLSDTVSEDDRIICIEPKAPHIGDVIGLTESDNAITVQFNKKPCKVPTSTCHITMDNIPVTLNTLIKDNANIKYLFSKIDTIMISDVLLAANFQPPSTFSNVRLTLTLNDEPSEYTALVKNGDSVEVILTNL